MTELRRNSVDTRQLDLYLEVWLVKNIKKQTRPTGEFSVSLQPPVVKKLVQFA